MARIQYLAQINRAQHQLRQNNQSFASRHSFNTTFSQIEPVSDNSEVIDDLLTQLPDDSIQSRNETLSDLSVDSMLNMHDNS